MNETTPRASIAGLSYLRDDAGKALAAIDATPDAAESLADNELLALHALTGGGNVNLAGEVRRRRQHHEQQAKLFAAHDHAAH